MSHSLISSAEKAPASLQQLSGLKEGGLVLREVPGGVPRSVPGRGGEDLGELLNESCLLCCPVES